MVSDRLGPGEVRMADPKSDILCHSCDPTYSNPNFLTRCGQTTTQIRDQGVCEYSEWKYIPASSEIQLYLLAEVTWSPEHRTVAKYREEIQARTKWKYRHIVKEKYKHILDRNTDTY